MKRIFLATVLTMVTLMSFGHRHVSESAVTVSDTLYYASNMLQVNNRADASYYRLLKKEGKGLSKHDAFQDFYLNGTLKAEGGYTFIDLSNDKNSKFDGDITTYYPNGKEKWRGTYKNGKRNGYFTMSMRDGSIASVLFENGKSKLNYFVVTRPDGTMQKRPIKDVDILL